VLLGDEGVAARAGVGRQCASVREQVDCLIDMATDPTLLGRTYQGWRPWI
jgi:DNA-dependent protein kinase catalytic subunit